MIDQNQENNQLSKELNTVFSELEIFKHLRNAGINKSVGFSCSYLFLLVFCLIFQHRDWFSLLESKKSDRYPAKDAVYRFLNQPTFNWHRFLLSFSASTIQKVERLMDQTRPKMFIIDDSSFRLLIEIVVKRWNFSLTVLIMLHRKCGFTKDFECLHWAGQMAVGLCRLIFLT